jgi:hypothetical protein
MLVIDCRGGRKLSWRQSQSRFRDVGWLQINMAVRSRLLCVVARGTDSSCVIMCYVEDSRTATVDSKSSSEVGGVDMGHHESGLVMGQESGWHKGTSVAVVDVRSRFRETLGRRARTTP